MRLIELKLRQYGRFGEANIYTDSKLTAIIGANESGKTTVLNSLLDLNTSGSWEKRYLVNAYSNEKEFIIQAKFAMEPQDITGFGDYDVKPRFLFMMKYYDGTLRWYLSDRPIKDSSMLQKLGGRLNGFYKGKNKRLAPEVFNLDNLYNFMEKLKSSTRIEAKTLKSDSVGVFLEDEPENEESRLLKDSYIQLINEYVDILEKEEEFYIEEGRKILHSRPKFLLYSENVRNLPWRSSLIDSGISWSPSIGGAVERT